MLVLVELIDMNYEVIVHKSNSSVFSDQFRSVFTDNHLTLPGLMELLIVV